MSVRARGRLPVSNAAYRSRPYPPVSQVSQGSLSDAVVIWRSALSTPEQRVDHASKEAPHLEQLDPHTQLMLRSTETDNRILRRALLAAVVFHVVLLWVTFPDWSGAKKIRDKKPAKVYKMEVVRFKPPAAAPQQQIPKRRTKKIPIPDPTPDEPEPIVVDEIVDPTLDLPEVDVAVFGIPDAPPFAGEGASDQPIHMGSGIIPPEKIFYPEPTYTEEARQARIQGSVILQIVIDKEGNVRKPTVIKGLPLGLDASAIETVKEWRFKPAVQDGEAVSVYFTLILNFSLQ